MDGGVAVQAVAAQEARNGGLGQARLARDLEGGQAMVNPQGKHERLLGSGGLAGAAVRTRRALAQARRSLGAKACHPLAHGALAHPGLDGHRLGGQPFVQDAGDDERSTGWREAGIMMDVHAAGEEEVEVAHPQSLKSSPHEQPIETSQLGTGSPSRP